MNIDEYIDVSPSEEDTLVLQHVTRAPQPKIPMVAQTLKKTRLEQLPLSDISSTMIRTIRRVPVKHLPEYFEQTCDWRPHKIAIICGSSQLTYQELDHLANRPPPFLISRCVGQNNLAGIPLER